MIRIEITPTDFQSFVSRSPVHVQVRRLKSGRIAIFVPIAQGNDSFAFRIIHNGKKAWSFDEALAVISKLTRQPEKRVAELLQNSEETTIEAWENI